MPATSTSKKTAKPATPTWSKVGTPKPKTPTAKPKTTAAKPASRTTKPRASNPKSKTQNSQSKIEIAPHVRREITALLLLVAAGLFVLGLLSWRAGGQGIVGYMGGFLAQMFGVAAWLVPAALAVVALVLFTGARRDPRWLSPLVPLGLILLLLGSMGFIHLFTNGQPAAEVGQGGGYLGLLLSSFLSDYLTRAGAGFVLFTVALSGFMLAFGVSLAQVVRGVGRPALAAGRLAGRGLRQAGSEVTRLMLENEARRQATPEPVRINGHPAPDDTSSLDLLDPHPALPVHDLTPLTQLPMPTPPPELVTLLGGDHTSTSTSTKTKPEPVINESKSRQPSPTPTPDPQPPTPSPLGYIWNLPPLTLLEISGEAKVSPADIKAKIKVIEETLISFNVEATVREVNTGPAVTQFAIEPGVGVRVNRVTALDKDLALALAAPDIRIEAPIPGQSRIGIEVPNVSLQVVGLRDIIESDPFKASKGRLRVALGRDTHGQPVVTDLAKLPHILVAGATGSGKSVFLNSMVIGFLLQFTPDDLRMLMIDPKRVELTGFNGIPHLLRPVVTDVRMEKDPQVRARDKAGTQNERERPLTAVEALKWALWEMERRYKLFAKGQRGADGITKVFRNIEQYRTFHKEHSGTPGTPGTPGTQGPGMEHLPYIVIIIDELADLMLTAPEEVETSLCRLAQLARATGIHLVVATQRPSVDVVTGLIKANFPARSAFAVTSQVDSKVILDSGGAEKLLGRGDMLYTASDESKPVRIQGTYVSDAEADKVVHFWRKQLPSLEDPSGDGAETPAPVQPMPMPDWLGSGDADAESELLEQAIELVKKSSYVSVSMLQRKLRVGYNRAARLVEQMEELGLISPANSDNRGKPREVLLGAPDYRGLDPEEPHEVDEDLA
ncbi:MAG: DNA translocase FtsK [Chloroflexia bacterium]